MVQSTISSTGSDYGLAPSNFTGASSPSLSRDESPSAHLVYVLDANSVIIVPINVPAYNSPHNDHHKFRTGFNLATSAIESVHVLQRPAKSNVSSKLNNCTLNMC